MGCYLEIGLIHTLLLNGYTKQRVCLQLLFTPISARIKLYTVLFYVIVYVTDLPSIIRGGLVLSYGTFSPTHLLNYCCFMIAWYVIIIGQYDMLKQKTHRLYIWSQSIQPCIPSHIHRSVYHMLLYSYRTSPHILTRTYQEYTLKTKYLVELFRNQWNQHI